MILEDGLWSMWEKILYALTSCRVPDGELDLSPISFKMALHRGRFSLTLDNG